MHTLIKIVLIISTLLLTSFGFAISKQNNIVAAKELNQLLSSFQTLTAKFTQTINTNTGNTIQTTSGDVLIKRPGKFYWFVQSPIQQLIIVNNNKSYLYEPDLEQVIVKKINDNFTQAPAILLTNSNATILKKFSISLREKNKNKIIFTLIPKSQNLKATKNIAIIFVNKKIISLNFTNQLDQTVAIKFNNVKINLPIADSKFVFVAPKGTEIIK